MINVCATDVRTMKVLKHVNVSVIDRHELDIDANQLPFIWSVAISQLNVNRDGLISCMSTKIDRRSSKLWCSARAIYHHMILYLNSKVLNSHLSIILMSKNHYIVLFTKHVFQLHYLKRYLSSQNTFLSFVVLRILLGRSLLNTWNAKLQRQNEHDKFKTNV